MAANTFAKATVLYAGEVKAVRQKLDERASSCARLCIPLLLAATLPHLANAAQLIVTVRTGTTPIERSRVTLMRAGNAAGAAATPVTIGTSDAKGQVQLTYTVPPGDILYLLAEGAPSASVRLAAVLGAAAYVPPSTVVNELTTVATAYAMAHFLQKENIAGPLPSLAIAAMTASSLANSATGEVSGILSRPPNGSETNTLATLNTLANLVASCIQSKEKESCQDLFAEARPPSSVTPNNTLEALRDIARVPWHNVVALYFLAPRKGPYSPALTGSPDSWTLTIKHTGNGREFNGPESLAFDQDGNLWAANRFEFGAGSAPGSRLIRLIPSGLDAPGAPYTGGGLSGASGIAIDSAGSIWLGNVAANSISRFDTSGKPLSPPAGIHSGRIKHPQGIAVDLCGNIWIANGDTESLTKFPSGDPNRAVVFNDLGIRDPFGIAVDAAGYIWATGSSNNRIAKFTAAGKPAPGSPFLLKGISKPLEIAVDSAGNIWVTNFNGHSVSQIRPDGMDIHSFPAGEGPWGLAIDGGDNLYIANNKRPALTVLCGARPANCPLGKQTGDPLSPPAGYVSNSLARLTSVAIDMAGNVWVANNTQVDPKNKANPGADSLVEFVGLAIPVKTPRIGPVQSPSDPPRACPRAPE